MNIIVNGGTRGIGRETVINLAQNINNQIIVTGRKKQSLSELSAAWRGRNRMTGIGGPPLMPHRMPAATPPQRRIHSGRAVARHRGRREVVGLVSQEDRAAPGPPDRAPD